MPRAVSDDRSDATAPDTPAAAFESPEPAGDPGRAVQILAIMVGLLWIAGALASAFVFLGAARLFALAPVEAGALAALVLLPAVMVWFSGAAAREGARARAEARRLADAADRLLSPAQTADLSARRLAVSVRGEITALDKALEQTLARIREVEGLIAKQAGAVDHMAEQAKAGAGRVIAGMEHEHSELVKISQDLNKQADLIGNSISRHTRVIAEAAQLAEQEVRAADDALGQRIHSFGAAAALITDRTQALSGAAQASADSALQLENALSNALDILAQATSLTDAARQSSEQALLAANSTAGAVRESTRAAIDDAKRVADLVRNEAVGIERDAAIALERLREAAETARAAALAARTAAEGDRKGGRAPAPPPAARATEPRHHEEPRFEEPPRRAPAPRPQESMFGEPERPAASAPQAGGAWTWRDLLSNVEDDEAPSQPKHSPAPRPRVAADDPVARLAQAVAEPRHPSGTPAAAQMLEQAGLRLGEVFSASALDRIAQRARNGTQARRRAVKDAAPEAVRRLTDLLTADQHANQDALAFLRNDGARIAELLGRGRAAMGSDATRAFLLIDAAAG